MHQSILRRTIVQLLVVILVIYHVNCGFTLKIDSASAQKFQKSTVISQNILQEQFNPKIYQNQMVCTNGMLKLIEYNASKADAQLIQFYYEGIQTIREQDIMISVSPNKQPFPQIVSFSDNGFTLSTGCPKVPNATNQNYYNQIKIKLMNINLKNNSNITNRLNPIEQNGNASAESIAKDYELSFLINCDRYNRHKKFQYGYLLIGIINAAITIGVALHSRIWSIKFNQKPLRILLTWKLFLLITVILIVVGITFYILAQKQFKMAFQIIKYLGLVVSFIFTFICMNQILYLFKPFKQIIYHNRLYNIRKCELGSIIFALVLFVVSLFVQNWVLYTFLAGCICVGSIKMLYFNSMQQAFYSLAISVCSVTLIAVILHFILPRSYNDYASQLSSPLFIQVPDLVDNLFKKCSWLPVVDIIVPGVFLSFLRTYDENFTTGWGGVYTVVGNISFLIATTIWITIEALYPFSVPFSLITYTLLLLSISLIAFKRNQLKTLWGGYFLQQNQISTGLLKQDSQKQHPFDQQALNAIKIKDSFSSKGDQQQDRFQSYDGLQVNPKVTKSAFRTKRQSSNDKNMKRKSPQKNFNVHSSSIR